MKIYTFIEQISDIKYENEKHSWNKKPELDKELNHFLAKNANKNLEVESHIEIIKHHNNAGFNQLVKVTIVKEK